MNFRGYTARISKPLFAKNSAGGMFPMPEGARFVTFCAIVIAAMFTTVVGMPNLLLAQLADPDWATNIGSLVPFFVMVFLTKGFVSAMPPLVREISGNLMGPQRLRSSTRLRGLLNVSDVQSRARIGALVTGEAVDAVSCTQSGALPCRKPL